MIKIIFIFNIIFILITQGFAYDMNNRQIITKAFIENSDIKIIDIRTEREWIDTGIIDGAYTLTFMDERGFYDIDNFTNMIDNVIKNKDEEFAIICRSGGRTSMLTDLLKNKNYKVINLDGGMNKLIQDGYNTEKYSK